MDVVSKVNFRFIMRASLISLSLRTSRGVFGDEVHHGLIGFTCGKPNVGVVPTIFLKVSFRMQRKAGTECQVDSAVGQCYDGNDSVVRCLGAPLLFSYAISTLIYMR